MEVNASTKSVRDDLSQMEFNDQIVIDSKLLKICNANEEMRDGDDTCSKDTAKSLYRDRDVVWERSEKFPTST